MAGPSLSVMICNYNHGRYIARAIEAILTQSRPPDEFIVLDDASTDDSVEVIDSFCRRYGCIRFLRHERNVGAMQSFREALAAARGDYFYGGGADDYVLPGFFASAMQIAAAYPEAGLICGNVVVVDPEGKEWSEAGISSWPEDLYASPDRLLHEYLDVERADHSLSGATIYRRSAFVEVGGYREELGHWADTFAIRAIGLKYGACYLPQRCSAFTDMPQSFSQKMRRDLKRMLDIVATAQSLMRSPQFRDRFPESHVARWGEEYRDILIEDQVRRLQDEFDRCHALFYQGVVYKSLLNRVVGSLFSRSITLQKWLWARCLRASLRRYPGKATRPEKSEPTRPVPAHESLVHSACS
jgi:glycosyltransferase involved in cell wall biosynthesis